MVLAGPKKSAILFLDEGAGPLKISSAIIFTDDLESFGQVLAGSEKVINVKSF